MTVYTIKTEDILHNYRTLCESTEAEVVPMLKADGYGLGAQKMSDILVAVGAQRLAFSRIEEAAAVQTEAEKWVLSCYHKEEDLSLLLSLGCTVAVDSLSQAQTLSALAGKAGTSVKVHLAVDTGFGRFGFTDSAIEDMAAVCRLQGLAVEGIFSHLGAAFFYGDDFADRQLAAFEKTVSRLEALGFSFKCKHIANSSALLRDRKFHLSAVRVGSALLGRLPVAFSLPLKRVGKLESEIVDIRLLPKGHNIGYGKVYTLKRDTRVAVLAVGSADGVQMKKDYDAFRFRDLVRYGVQILKMMLKKDNRMRVRVNGKSVPVLGRVALTHTFVDVTDVSAKVGDRVELPVSPLTLSANVKREYL